MHPTRSSSDAAVSLAAASLAASLPSLSESPPVPLTAATGSITASARCDAVRLRLRESSARAYLIRSPCSARLRSATRAAIETRSVARPRVETRRAETIASRIEPYH